MIKEQRLIDLNHAAISITKEAHILIQIKEDQEIELPEIEAINAAKNQLAQNKPYTVIFASPQIGNISIEAMRFSASNQVYHNAIAKAIVANSLSSRIIGNFFIKMIKPPAPTKLFKTIDEASVWLNSMKTSLQ
jgi:hypothetical protein